VLIGDLALVMHVLCPPSYMALTVLTGLEPLISALAERRELHFPYKTMIPVAATAGDAPAAADGG